MYVVFTMNYAQTSQGLQKPLPSFDQSVQGPFGLGRAESLSVPFGYRIIRLSARTLSAAHSSKFDFETVNDNDAATKRLCLISTPATDTMESSRGSRV